MLLTRKLLNQCFLWLSWSHQHFAVLITILSFHHSCFITSIINRITWLLSLVEHELLPFQSTWVHNRYLVGFALFNLLLYVYCFVDHCLIFWSLQCVSFEWRLLVTLLAFSGFSQYIRKLMDVRWIIGKQQRNSRTVIFDY
jgi:hypothetical protein